MLINAILRANNEQREELIKWITTDNFDKEEKIKAVTKLYNKIGIRQLCEKKINDYFAEALTYLEKVNVPEEKKTALQRFTDQMMHREN